MKGRCSGVSLFNCFSTYIIYYKIRKPLPGVLKSLYSLCCFSKRETPHCACRKGSMTIEAAIVLPLFVGFFAFILFYFRIMQVQLTVQGALEETGRNLALLAVKELEEPVENIGYEVIAKGMLSLKLKDDRFIEQYVSGGATGVMLAMSEFEGDYIELNANYIMKFPIKFWGKRDFLICQRTQFRKWNGWHGVLINPEIAELVYVTEYGEVYHMRRSCTYLNLSIQKILREELEIRRNYSGERYEICELCGDESDSAVVYITNYGECYHNTITCSGLKRIIYQKLLSEVGGMPACTKCSK